MGGTPLHAECAVEAQEPILDGSRRHPLAPSRINHRPVGTAVFCCRLQRHQRRLQVGMQVDGAPGLAFAGTLSLDSGVLCFDIA